MLRLLEGYTNKDSKEKNKKAQNPEGFEPTISRFWGMCVSAELQPLPKFHVKLKRTWNFLP